MNQLKGLFVKIYSNLEIIIIALMLFAGPFVVNYDDLPKGYEITKVFFYQISTIILILAFLLKQTVKVITRKEEASIKIDKSTIVLIIAIFLIILTTLFSSFTENTSLETFLKSITVVGNQFRFQGAITHILMVCFAYILYKVATKRNVLVLLFAFFASSFIQSIVAINQLYYFLVNDFKVIFEGYYINGTFGQANFFSGRIMIGILAAIFFISYGSNILHNKRFMHFLSWIFLYVLLPIATLVLIIALVASFSTWGIVSTGILVLTLIVYEVIQLFQKKQKRNIFGFVLALLLSVGLIAGYLLLKQMYFEQVDNLRLHIWEQIYKISTSADFSKTLIGYGYDTLGEVFRNLGIFKGVYIDRAHNFFLDVLMQNGFVSLLGILFLIAVSVTEFVFAKLSSKVLTYFFLGMLVWLFRSFVHESGIVNLYDFLILFAVTISLQKELTINWTKIKKLLKPKIKPEEVINLVE